MRICTWYKLLSIFSVLILLMNSTAIAPAMAVPNANVIFSETSEVSAGSTAEIPISIKNNTGIAGFGILITYDPNVFTPISVTDTGGVIPGRTLNSIGGNLPNIPENTIKIMCSGDSNFTADGLLFTVKFSVDPATSGSTVLHLSYDKNDTIDEDINDVVLSCCDISLTVMNSGLDQLPQIALTAENVPAERRLLLRGILKEPNGLSAAGLTLQYDASAFCYTSMNSPAAISGITQAADSLSFSLSGVNAVGKGETLFEVVLAYSTGISAGIYQFYGSAASVVGAADIHFVDCSIELTGGLSATAVVSSVSGLANNQGHIVSVPVIIQMNPGLMGYKLSFSFNSADITPVRTVNDLLFPTGSFSDNIGLKPNSFDVLWNGIDPSDNNGQVLHIEFKILTGTVKETTVSVSYSAPDTYDGSYREVALQCNDVVIALNSYTEIRNASSATCCESGYSGDTYCLDCGEKLAAGSSIPATGCHVDADGKWELDGARHWHTCYYGTRFDIASHFGGAATCTEKAKCTACGAEYGTYAAHSLQHHDRVEPDSEHSGNIEYWSCERCGRYFSDSDGTTEINAADIIIQPVSVETYSFLGGEVLIEAPTEVIPHGYAFDVRKIVPPPEDIVDFVHSHYGSETPVIAYHEIRLMDSGGNCVTQLNGAITIKIKMPAEYVGNPCVRVFLIDESGTLVQMAVWVEGEYLCYQTDWLETYA